MRVFDTSRRDNLLDLAFSPDGGLLAVGAFHAGVTVFDVAGRVAPVVLDTTSLAYQSHVAFAAGPVVRAATFRGCFAFDPTTGRQVGADPPAPDTPDPPREFALSPDETRLVSTYHNWVGAVRLVGWSVTPGGWERAWVVTQGVVSVAAFAPAGDRFAVIGSPDPERWKYYLLVRDAATGEVAARGEYPFSMLARPHYRPDGRQVVAAHDMSLVVWDTRMPAKPVLVRNDSRRHFTAAAYHPSARYLFTTSNDATVTVWDTDTWARVKRFDWDIGPLRAVAASPDGLLAAAGSDRGRVVVWDVDV